MGVKVATTCLQWSQPIIPHSPSSSQTLTSVIASPSSKRRRMVCRYVQRLNRSALFGTSSTKLHRSRSCEYPKSPVHTLKRACSASFDDAFSDEEFSKKIQELALRFQLADDDDDDDEGVNSNAVDSGPELVSDSSDDDNPGVYTADSYDSIQLPLDSLENPSRDWLVESGDIIPESIMRKANKFDLPLSLRIIKRKMQWQDGVREAGESAYCSVKKAFSSMVFIIRELHSYTLQMREILFTEDLQGILVRVQKEMHASFVWLFQQVFSHTPTLMVYVMILLANFTVYSLGSNTAFAASPAYGSCSVSTTESASVIEIQDNKNKNFDSSSIKTFSLSSSSGRTSSIGGNNGGGGKVPPVASGTDGDGGVDGSDHYRTIVPDEASQLSSFGTTREAEAEAESVSGQVIREEEMSVWNSVVEETSKMQSSIRDEALDLETMQRFVSPVNAKIDSDDYADYFRTDLLYQTGLTQEPNNPLLLANYAQFLYLVAHDYDRAEEYFKRAIGVEPPDAEAYSKYASFLWKVRNDLWAAEETFLEAISADPSNSYYAANYAHFLWNTGGEDTCYPLDTPQQEA